jgi:thiosulfate/3-mercaptopyruvate sulfurtransferase
MQTVTPEEFRDMIDGDEEFTVVDTRDEGSFASWHIEGAVNYRYLPDQTLDPERFTRETGLTRQDAIVTMCAKGISSKYLAEDLDRAGFEDVTLVEDGMEGWSTVYDVVTVVETDEVEVVQLQRRAKGCLGYVVASGGEAAVVDATRHTEEFVALAEDRGWELTRVLDTHVHADHISGGRALADAVGATYHLPERASDRGVEYQYEPLERNEVVRVGDTDIKALATPGHTSEIASYLVGSEAVLTGDTLFVDSVGRTELQFGASAADTGAEQLYRSLHATLLAEPDSVTVLPGHFAIDNDGSSSVVPGEPVATTVGTVRTGLDLLAVDERTFVERITDRLPEKPPNYEDVIAINTGRDAPEDEQAATELELGPNRCAAADD